MSGCRQIGQNIFPMLSNLGLTNRWVSRSDVWTSDMIQRYLSILMWEVTLVMKKSKIELENHSEYWNISQQVDIWEVKIDALSRSARWALKISSNINVRTHPRDFIFRKSFQISAECKFANSNFNLISNQKTIKDITWLRNHSIGYQIDVLPPY